MKETEFFYEPCVDEAQTKCSFPFRTIAFSGEPINPADKKTSDKKGIYSCMIASCSAMLDVEMTIGRLSHSHPFPVAATYFLIKMQATRYA